MPTATQLKSYYASIGLALWKGDVHGVERGGWSVGPIENLPQDGEDACFFNYFPNLRQVERGWRCMAASLFAEERLMRRLLAMYRTASTDELEAILSWMKDLSAARIPGIETAFASPEVAEWLSTTARNHAYWTFGEDMTGIYTDFPMPELPSRWRQQAARLYVRYYCTDGTMRRGLLHRKILWLCERACRERLRALPKACSTVPIRNRL
ncbi:hypothetical protein [Luteibacter sp.]|uniref:hypothetical protein n=1 Tax=Luteibacter sp. TaxID=1886636 RepID=UPI00280892E4|nr:hypothetical protein [Luteibacter sp.]MDQ8048101.1 hypothetical protein [Luteibacter sp.]